MSFCPLKETQIKSLVPEMGEEDVRKAVEPLILEFFENNDSMEVLFTLQVCYEEFPHFLFFGVGGYPLKTSIKFSEFLPPA